MAFAASVRGEAIPGVWSISPKPIVDARILSQGKVCIGFDGNGRIFKVLSSLLEQCELSPIILQYDNIAYSGMGYLTVLSKGSRRPACYCEILFTGEVHRLKLSRGRNGPKPLTGQFSSPRRHRRAP